MARVLVGLALVLSVVLLVGAGVFAVERRNDARAELSAHAGLIARQRANLLSTSIDTMAGQVSSYWSTDSVLAVAKDGRQAARRDVADAERVLEGLRHAGSTGVSGTAAIVDVQGRDLLTRPTTGLAASRLGFGTSPLLVTQDPSPDGPMLLVVAGKLQGATGTGVKGSLAIRLEMDEFLGALEKRPEEAALVEANSGQMLSTTKHGPDAAGRTERQRIATIIKRAREQDVGLAQIDGRVWAFQRVQQKIGVWGYSSWFIAVRTVRPVPGLPEAMYPVGLLMALGGLVLGAGGLFALWRRRRDLERSAAIDQLTGIANRRVLLQDLQQIQSKGDPVRLAMFDLNGFKEYNDNFGHQAGDALLRRVALALQKATRPARAYRLGGDEFCVVSPADSADEIEARAATALTEHGQGFTVDASWGSVAFPQESATASEALAIADERMYRHKRGGRESALTQTKGTLKRLMAEGDPALADHHERVACLAELTGREMRLSDELMPLLRDAAELHDIGLLAIPATIRNKAGTLDDDEREFINSHPVIGERILSAAQSLRPVAAIVRASHERWDGGGYPERRESDGTPLAARIISACDAYDTMTHDQPYRAALSAEAALEELRAGAGHQFDAEVIAALERVLDNERSSPGELVPSARG